MRYCVLASGSNGNACLVEAGDTKLLIDLGIGPRVLKWRLEPLGLRPRDIDHLLVTHEHTDHVRGIEHLLKRQPDLQIHATRGTIGGLPPEARKRAVPLPSTLTIDALTIHPFRTSHDGAESVGFRLEAGGYALGFATDLGCFCRDTIRHLTGCDGLVVESNHCPDLLRTGPYPPFLKSRVGGRQGHLSNRQCRDLLEKIAHPGLRHVTLAHLSEKNNTPEAALCCVSELFSNAEAPELTTGQRRSALPPVDLMARRDRGACLAVRPQLELFR
jgi:phosphoribosyl 1,2-cyclic phosphodiesterase